MKILKEINERHSCRFFDKRPIDNKQVESIIEAARWAPSGKNSQPCRYVIIYQQEIREKISLCSTCEKWMRNAPVLVAVYLDKECSYDYKKDLQSAGAAIENMCLQAEYLGIGSCWVGEILAKEREVNEILAVPINYELMAVICLGYEAFKMKKTHRIELRDLVTILE